MYVFVLYSICVISSQLQLGGKSFDMLASVLCGRGSSLYTSGP